MAYPRTPAEIAALLIEDLEDPIVEQVAAAQIPTIAALMHRPPSLDEWEDREASREVPWSGFNPVTVAGIRNQPVQASPPVYLPFFAMMAQGTASLDRIQVQQILKALKRLDEIMRTAGESNLVVQSISWLVRPVQMGMDRWNFATGLLINGDPIDLHELHHYVMQHEIAMEDDEEKTWLVKFHQLLIDLRKETGLEFHRYPGPKGFGHYESLETPKRPNVVMLASERYAEGFYIINKMITLNWAIAPVAARDDSQELPWDTAIRVFWDDPIMVSDVRTPIADRKRLLFRDYIRATRQGEYIPRYTARRQDTIAAFAKGEQTVPGVPDYLL